MNYTQLTSIPLFMGISGDDLAVILDRVELLETELYPGEVYVHGGDVCQCMSIVREGTMQRNLSCGIGEFTNRRHQQSTLTYNVEECIDGPFILEPERLFGLDLRHQSTWTAVTTCRLMMISKEDIRQTLMYVPVWRINFINLLCTNLQRNIDKALPHPEPTLKERIVNFLRNHKLPQSQETKFSITLEQMGYYLGADRRSINNCVNELCEEGVLGRERKIIKYIEK